MTSFNWYRSLVSAALLSFTSLAATGCVVASPDESDESFDNGSEAISSSWKCDIGQLGTARCQNAIADIRAQAAAAGRAEILERGIDWLVEGVTYNRNGTHEGFRRDCSGFVSMCWSYSSNPSTAYFPPFVTGKYAVPLGSVDELAPGDAINKTYRDPYGHVMLFAGWAAADHSQLYFLHHYSTGKPVALVQVGRDQLADFIPIRSVNAPPVSSEPPPPPPAAPSGCGVLAPNQSLAADQGTTSCDGRFTLVQQSDGNLVLYQAGVGALWSTGTNGTKGRTMVMQDDGNLVIYTTGGTPVWSSKTSGYPGAWLAIQDDGNVVIYHHQAIWSSGTSGH